MRVLGPDGVGGLDGFGWGKISMKTDWLSASLCVMNAERDLRNQISRLAAVKGWYSDSVMREVQVRVPSFGKRRLRECVQGKAYL